MWEIVGSQLGRVVTRLGLNRYFRPDLEFGDEIKLDARRRPEHGLNQAAAIIYELEVKNRGREIAKSCCPHLKFDMIYDSPDGQVKIIMDTQVFWADDNVATKSISRGEKATLAFAMSGTDDDSSPPYLQFPSEEGWRQGAMPRVTVDDTPLGRESVGDANTMVETSQRSIGIPLPTIQSAVVEDARIYVTSENAARRDIELEFVFGDGFSIQLRE